MDNAFYRLMCAALQRSFIENGREETTCQPEENHVDQIEVLLRFVDDGNG